MNDSNVQPSRTTGQAVKTQIESNTPKLQTIITDKDVELSYKKKARKGTERSKLYVRNIGSEQFVKDNINRKLSNSVFRQPSDTTQAKKTSYKFTVSDNGFSARTGVIKTEIIDNNKGESSSRIATPKNKAVKSNTTTTAKTYDVNLDLVNRVGSLNEEQRKESGDSSHTKAISVDSSHTISRDSLRNNSEPEPFSIKTESSNKVLPSSHTSTNKKIQKNLSLSSAFFSCTPRINQKHYSNDVMQALTEVNTFTHADPFLVNSYLKNAKPHTAKDKFTYKVVKRKMMSDMAHDNVKTMISNPTIKNLPKIVGKEAFATYHERLLMYSKRPRCMKELLSENIQGLYGAFSEATGAIGGKLMSSEDWGAASAGAVIIAAQTGVNVGKGVRKASVFVRELPNTIEKIEKKAVDISDAIGNIGNRIKTSVKSSYTVVRDAVSTIRKYGLVSRTTLSKVGHRASKMSLSVVSSVAQKTTNFVTKSAVDILHGKPLVVVSSLTGGAASLMGKSDDEYVRGTGTAIKTADYGVRTGASLIKTGTGVIKTGADKGSHLVGSGVQNAIYISQNGLIHTVDEAAIITGYKANKKALMAVRNVGKNVGRTIRNAGLTAKRVKGATEKTVNIIKGVTQFISNAINAIVGSTAALPIIIVVLILVVIVTLGGALMSVGTIFGGSFSIAGQVIGGIFSPEGIKLPFKLPFLKDDDADIDTETTVDFDVDEFLANTEFGVPHYRQEYISDLVKYLDDNKGKCNVVRLRMDGVNQADVIELTEEGVSSIFYTDKELIDIIQPVFQTKILLDYDLTPTDTEAQNTLQDIFDELFPDDFSAITQESMEYCGQDLKTGLGTPIKDTGECVLCHHEHSDFAYALDDCPNYETKYHSNHRNYTDHPDSVDCEKCDVKSCVAYDRTGDPWKVYNWFGEHVTTIDEEGHLKVLIDHMNDSNTAHTWVLQYTVHGNGVDITGHVTTWDITIRSDGSWECNPDTRYSPTGMSEMDKCDNWESKCSGYNICKGHKVLTTTLSLSGYETLLEKEFLEDLHNLQDDVDDLKDVNKDDTDVTKYNDELSEKEDKVRSIEESLEFCYEYMELLSEKYVTVSEYRSQEMNFIDDDATNKAVVEFAINEVGTIGGKRYIQNMYYDKEEDEIPKNLEWSGCFVVWCKEKAMSGGRMSSRYATAREWQRDVSHKPRMFSTDEIISGDTVIFLDFNGDGKAQKCGLVVGKTDDYVFVVEGNCADKVQITKYKYDDSQIIGYI